MRVRSECSHSYTRTTGPQLFRFFSVLEFSIWSLPVSMPVNPDTFTLPQAHCVFFIDRVLWNGGLPWQWLRIVTSFRWFIEEAVPLLEGFLRRNMSRCLQYHFAVRGQSVLVRQHVHWCDQYGVHLYLSSESYRKELSCTALLSIKPMSQWWSLYTHR